MVALLLVAFSLGLSNFAAAISIGVSGITSRQRLEVGIAFGVFEAGMPVVGFIVGHQLAHDLGHAARWFGGSILIGTGVYALVQARRPTRPVAAAEADRGFRIAITALALSIDNLAVGFALGTRHISLALAAIMIGLASVAMSLVALELGARLGTRLGERAELLSGSLLIAVGVAIAAGAL